MSCFTETDTEFDLKSFTREEQELTVLGMMMWSPENYELARAQLQEDDFVHYGEFFKAILEVYKRTTNVNYDALADICEEWGIIEPIDNDWRIPNEGYQTIGKIMVCGSDTPYDMQFLVNLLKAREDSTPIPACTKENTYIQVGGLGGEPEIGNAVASKTADSVSKSFPPRISAFPPVSESVKYGGNGNFVSDRVKEYVENTTGWFSYSDLDRECDIQPSEKTARRLAIKKLCVSGKLQGDSNREGWYRYKNINTTTMKFIPTAQRQDIPLEFPLDIQNHVKTLPKSIIVVAGVTGAGKTAFLMDFMRRNQDRFKIHYYCSELEEEGFSERWEALGIGAWRFEAKQVSGNFENYIELAPDDIHVIDYLEITDKFYLVNQVLTDIHRALNKGAAVVALQKTDNKIYGRGGDHSAEKSTLYITLDNPELGTQGSHKLTLVKTRTFKNPAINPRGMTAEFKLVGGCRFIVTKPLGYGTQGLPKIGDKQLLLV